MANTTNAHATDTASELLTAQGIFSVYSDVVTVEHREFYERILSALNGIFPVCTQGKSTALVVSEDPTEQEQITDLMKRVESFSHELLEVTKQLFGQSYHAKEQFYRMIYSKTAYLIINLMDRNLLERTCDVRWWALETAFSDCIQLTQIVRTELNLLLTQLRGTEDGVQLKECLAVNSGWEVNSEHNTKLQQCLTQLSANQKTDDLVNRIDQVLWKTMFACDRLEDITCSYTLYRDLVIANSDGTIIANSNKITRSHLLGTNIAQEKWFQQALATKDGTQYHAEDLVTSKVERLKSLIYSAAIRENSDNYGRPIGVLGVFFDFQGEAQMILDDHMPHDGDSAIEDGWLSFLTNSDGVVIASSDEGLIRLDETARIPRKHRTPRLGIPSFSYSVIEGRESAIFSSRTDGYLDYPGLGWAAHLIVPKDHLFHPITAMAKPIIGYEELMQSRIVPDINKQTYAKVQDDKESIQLISLNGIVFASKLGKRGVALGPIFDQIKQTGEFTTAKMEVLLREMAVGELAMNLQAMENFSKQAIDLLDRNLFERAADIRWWSTDHFLWTALMDPTAENYQKAAHRLEVISGSYTMYRNLVLANRLGEIVASAKGEERPKLRQIAVYDDPWFAMAMRTARSSEYAVQDVMKSRLDGRKDRSLIYAGGVRESGSRQGDPIGALGILFDWDTEAKKILTTCLPKNQDGELIEGCAAFYTNSHHEIIESTDSEIFPVGRILKLPNGHVQLKQGQSTSGRLTYEQRQFILGSSRTKGYREYAGLGWTAHVVRPI